MFSFFRKRAELPPPPPQPLDLLSFAEMEQAFAAEYDYALTRAGGALCVRPRNSGSYRTLRQLQLASFVHNYLVDTGASHLWTVDLPGAFEAWLVASASPVGEGAVVKIPAEGGGNWKRPSHDESTAR